MALQLVSNYSQDNVHVVDESIAFKKVTPSEDEKSELGYVGLRQQYFTQFLELYPGLMSFVRKHLKIDDLDIYTTEVCDTCVVDELDDFENNSLENYFNLNRFNDFRYLNKFILKAHSKLKQNGIFIARAETLDIHKNKFYEKFPKFIAGFFYGLHFIYARAMAKLPVLNKCYHCFSKGRNRALSRAEVLGRLYFCGFKVVAVEETDNELFFIAQKVKEPVENRVPSYGLLIKLKRVGHDGNPVYIHKVRTMHPYSEFLQEYIYEQNKLNSNGKFKDDFRITGWGRIFRKYWIDELPQLWNWLRGDIRLVGVRALSEHYFSLYPKELQKLRVRFKPGIIPPYYVDLPKTFDEILESEKNYFKKKLNGHFVDNVYFFKAMYNILFRSARSL